MTNEGDKMQTRPNLFYIWIGLLAAFVIVLIGWQSMH
jgi:hypothetical protein